MKPLKPYLSFVHLTDKRRETIHVFFNPDQVDNLRLGLADAFRDFGIHVAVIDCTQLYSIADFVSAIEQAYSFPTHSRGRVNWDSFNDWISDLSWLEPPKGFILVILNPKTVFGDDPVEFGVFLDVFSETSKNRAETNDIPFHMVLGPIDFRFERFIHVLKASDSFCKLCQFTLADRVAQAKTS